MPRPRPSKIIRVHVVASGIILLVFASLKIEESGLTCGNGVIGHQDLTSDDLLGSGEQCK